MRIEKNDLRSVTLLEAKAKVKDIAISRERITLKDVLQEGTYSLKIGFQGRFTVSINIFLFQILRISSHFIPKDRKQFSSVQFSCSVMSDS